MKNTVGRNWFSSASLFAPLGSIWRRLWCEKKRGCRPPHHTAVSNSPLCGPTRGEESGESRTGKERKGGNRAEHGKEGLIAPKMVSRHF